MPDWKSENRRAKPVDGRSDGRETERTAPEQPEQAPSEQEELAAAPVEIEHAATEAPRHEPTSEPAPEAVSRPLPDEHPSAPHEPAQGARDESAPSQPEPAAAAPPPAPQPEPAEPPREPVPLPAAPLASQPPQAEPPTLALTQEVSAAPRAEPEIVHPPVPADRLPPAEEERKPFYKRDLSFRRAKKEAEHAPVALPEEEGEERKPFYKRDVSFGRSKKEADPAAQPKPSGRRLPDLAGARRKSGKSLVGLKVGASQIAAAQVANNGYAELIQVAREPLALGIVVGGELREPDALAEALKAFFAKHKLPKRGVRLGIANNRIGVRAFEISGVTDARQLANAIKFRAQDALPIPVEEAVLDYQILDERVNEEGDTVRRVLLVVAYRELVDRFIAACRKAGIHLAGIDLEGFALLRSLQAPRDHTDGDAALVAVTIGHDRSTFAVSDGRRCEFTRVLEWGGSALNVAIARALDISPGEAEPIKLQLSLVGNEAPAGLSEAQAAEAREAVSRQVQAFARELVSSLQFYQNQPGSLGIGEIAITGGTAHLSGLAEELQRLIGVTVRVGNPLGRVKVGKKLGEPEQLGSLAVAIGLGIED